MIDLDSLDLSRFSDGNGELFRPVTVYGVLYQSSAVWTRINMYVNILSSPRYVYTKNMSMRSTPEGMLSMNCGQNSMKRNPEKNSSRWKKLTKQIVQIVMM